MGAAGAQPPRLPARYFNHTHISVYLVGTFAVACILYDSTQVSFQRRGMLTFAYGISLLSAVY